ncbi:L-ascorbate metabolism protein UlaG (beta-lactamase superfamily) [Tumebacillus sp. BK434]|uniref:MBL fold metallo-hydrolase n=1 Tax=Tumebacillus sp. BK434 TaxID=2512169 RepID=UPI001045AEA6|nr:MBL fold metallo-hydrolase [Tumebacillus sp. BK434]TCP59196.1 L-ascorbate metabolism protein UlaG (beta-lactamase superfamily) [Tumebacillus sp. BK434]
MKVLLWLLGILVFFITALTALVWLQYKRLRRMQPQPIYKHPRHKPAPDEWSEEQVTVSWIGHSTLVLNILGKTIITDPVFSEKVGVSLGGPLVIGPKRHTAAALTVEETGAPDLILLSHAHLDHFDLPSLKRLQNRSTDVITAQNTSRLLQKLSFRRVLELGGRERVELDDGLTITAVPVKHWGRRFPWNADYGWTGYLIEYCGVRLFFAGDTAYTPSFKELRRYGPIDIAFLPIGAYSPDSYQGNHCTPEQAWQMFLDSGAQHLVPIHWDTFVLSHEPVDEPLQRLLQIAGADASRILLREHGETFTFTPAVLHENTPC